MDEQNAELKRTIKLSSKTMKFILSSQSVFFRQLIMHYGDISFALRITEDFERGTLKSVKVSKRSKPLYYSCLLYTSPSPRDKRQSRMPSSA